MSPTESLVFPALLKHWRARRAMSQLDLALAANVSARHISFLETGRARPSREMMLRLGAALEIPLRDQDVMLEAGGHKPEFAAPAFCDGLPPAVARAIERMMEQHEPYPMMVMDHGYDVLRHNRGAMALLGHLIAEPEALTEPLNAFRMLFDPRMARPAVVEWEQVARHLLSRLHREALARPSSAALVNLVDEVLAYPDVPEDFRYPDFSVPSQPVLSLKVQCGDSLLSFIMTVTVFNAPQNVTLDDLRIESYFPTDDETAAFCARLAAEAS